MNLSKTILSTLLAASTLSFASAKLVGWAGQTFDEAERQQLEKMNRNSRLLALVKTLWPECTQWQYKNAFTCKDFIDNELAQMGYPEIDVVIVYRRNADSPTSNAMVIFTDDDGICVGRDGDGLLHYDWDWCGAGYKLTNSVAIEESSKLIKPSRWTKMIEKNPNVSCENGVVIHDKSPNAFGGDFNINTCSTLAGYNKKVTALSQSVPMPAQGCRKIAPIDCSGMSAMDACEVVKHKVPDANDKGKQIECWIAYRPGSVTLAETQIDTKVIIFAYEKNNHVIGIPALRGPVPS